MGCLWLGFEMVVDGWMVVKKTALTHKVLDIVEIVGHRTAEGKEVHGLGSKF